MNIWPRRLELKKETRQAAISRRRVTQSNLSWNWRQTILFLTLEIPARDRLDMYPCLIRMRAQPFQNFGEKRSWSFKTRFLKMTGAKISTKGIWGTRVDLNLPISVSRPLAVQNHNLAPHRDVCNFRSLKRKSLVTNQLSCAEFSRV